MVRARNVHFLARCPQCGNLSTQTYARTALLRDVYSGDSVELYCVTCEHGWEAGWHELAGIKRLLGQDALAD
jgi:hypothetical protein